VDADDVILDRLLMLRNEVSYLKREREALHTFEAYRWGPLLRRTVEGWLQVAVEVCLDVGRRMIAREGFRFPGRHQKSFVSWQMRASCPRAC